MSETFQYQSTFGGVLRRLWHTRYNENSSETTHANPIRNPNPMPAWTRKQHRKEYSPWATSHSTRLQFNSKQPAPSKKIVSILLTICSLSRPGEQKGHQASNQLSKKSKKY